MRIKEDTNLYDVCADCANAFTHDGTRAEASECSVVCADNVKELCGAESKDRGVEARTLPDSLGFIQTV